MKISDQEYREIQIVTEEDELIVSITDEDVIVEFGNNKNCRIPMKKENIVEIDKQNGEE